MSLEASEMEPYDVVIVGAGPTGLATAVGLQNLGIERLLVIDKTHSFRRAGRTVDLLPTGLKALKYLDSNVYDRVLATGSKYVNLDHGELTTNDPAGGEDSYSQPSRLTIKDLNGKTVDTISFAYDEWLERYDEGRISLSWYDLQSILRHRIPFAKVKSNHYFVSAEEEVQCGTVRIRCSLDTQENVDSTERGIQSKSALRPSIKSIRARVLIGADGINSNVRKTMCENTDLHALMQPEYSGFTGIECRSSIGVPGDIINKIKSEFLQDLAVTRIICGDISRDSSTGTQPSIIIYKRPHGQLSYFIQVVIEPIDIHVDNARLAIQRVAQELEDHDYPKEIIEMVRCSQLEFITIRPFFMHRAYKHTTLAQTSKDKVNTLSAQLAWSKGRVVLVGDAAHGMPPFLAEGTNQGFEDAAVLSALIGRLRNKELEDTSKLSLAFKQYEEYRIPLVYYVQQSTLERLAYFDRNEYLIYNQVVHGRNLCKAIQALVQLDR